MSISSLVQVFESGASAPQRRSLPLDDLIRRSLEVAANDVATSTSPPKEARSLFSDTGDYLAQLARILGHLTENLVHGSHVEIAIEEMHERAHVKNSTSDLSAISVIDVDCGKLRKINELTQKFRRDVQDIWNAGPPMVAADSPSQHSTFSPFRDPNRPSIKRSPSFSVDVDYKPHNIQNTLSSPQVPAGLLSPGANASESDDSSDEDEKFSNIDMDALRQRGKGSYFCPLGTKCDKGGVDKDGRPIRFDRNSSFAQHCNKHRKPWRCDIPGCPNPPKKRKFARRDGLERHKSTVKHVVSK